MHSNGRKSCCLNNLKNLFLKCVRDEWSEDATKSLCYSSCIVESDKTFSEMLRLKQSIILMSVALLWIANASAQITTTTPNVTPVQAVEDILLSAGVNAFNITYNGSAADAQNQQGNVQEFDATNTGFPIEEGVLMSTDGPVLNDQDLSTITGGTYTNGAIIEFDFVATGDTLSFNYIFASSEYSSYTCSNYNDVFGFFLSGPGINGPFTNNAENIATVPGSTVPVAINTVNSGTASSPGGDPANCAAEDPNWQANSIYFTTGNNTLFSSSNSPMSSFNGSTVVLPANSDLTCGDTFHIKLAIANDVDQALNSGVFLQAKSFTTGAVEISENSTNTVNALDTLLVEGCSELSIDFLRPPGSDPNDTIITDIIYGGDATTGDDYNVLVPGDSVTFLPGDDTLTYTFAPNADGVDEPAEQVTISTVTITECGDTVYSELIYYIVDRPPNYYTEVNDTTILCSIDSAYLYSQVYNGFPPYSYQWEDGTATSDNWFADLVDGQNTMILTVTDECGFEVTDTSYVELNQTLAIDTMIQYPADCGIPNGAVSGQGSGFTGTPNYQWEGPGQPAPDSINASVWQDLPSGWYYFTIEDDVCTVEDSIFLEQDPPPEASFEANPMTGNAPLDVTFTNTSDPAVTYDWDFGNGQTNSVNDQSTQSTTYTEEGTYTVTLTISDGNCTDQATQQILVTLILPLTYDMPNVFTPNGDNVNDVFTINSNNAVSLEMVIMNRWGNVVFESNDIGAKWNGKIQNAGAECTDGTYFYKFKIKGQDGVEKEEHGFVHLVRDTEEK